MASYTFGIATPTGSFVNWLVESVSHNYNAQEALALNEVGEPVVAHYYQKTDEVSFTAIVPDGATIPQAGVTFTFGGTLYYCTGSSKQESNTDFPKYTINGKRFLATGLPDASSSGA